jgi:hypothetical protein
MATVQKKKSPNKLELRGKSLTIQSLINLGAYSEGISAAVRLLGLPQTTPLDKEFLLEDVLPKLPDEYATWALRAAGVLPQWEAAIGAARERILAENNKKDGKKLKRLEDALEKARARLLKAQEECSTLEVELDELESDYVEYSDLRAEVVKNSDLARRK